MPPAPVPVAEPSPKAGDEKAEPDPGDSLGHSRVEKLPAHAGPLCAVQGSAGAASADSCSRGPSSDVGHQPQRHDTLA